MCGCDRTIFPVRCSSSKRAEASCRRCQEQSLTPVRIRRHDHRNFAVFRDVKVQEHLFVLPFAVSARSGSRLTSQTLFRIARTLSCWHQFCSWRSRLPKFSRTGTSGEAFVPLYSCGDAARSRLPFELEKLLKDDQCLVADASVGLHANPTEVPLTCTHGITPSTRGQLFSEEYHGKESDQ